MSRYKQNADDRLGGDLISPDFRSCDRTSYQAVGTL